MVVVKIVVVVPKRTMWGRHQAASRFRSYRCYYSGYADCCPCCVGIVVVIMVAVVQSFSVVVDFGGGNYFYLGASVSGGCYLRCFTIDVRSVEIVSF